MGTLINWRALLRKVIRLHSFLEEEPSLVYYLSLSIEKVYNEKLDIEKSLSLLKLLLNWKENWKRNGSEINDSTRILWLQ